MIFFDVGRGRLGQKAPGSHRTPGLDKISTFLDFFVKLKLYVFPPSENVCTHLERILSMFGFDSQIRLRGNVSHGLFHGPIYNAYKVVGPIITIQALFSIACKIIYYKGQIFQWKLAFSSWTANSDKTRVAWRQLEKFSLKNTRLVLNFLSVHYFNFDYTTELL